MYKDVKADGTTVLTTGISMADIQAAIDAAVLAAQLAENPVGTIRMSVTNTNPGTYLTGTTWVAWGSGRVPTGVDTGQTEFDTVEETGGSKTHTLTVAQMPTHNHSIAHDHLTKSGTGGTANSAYFLRTGSTGELENGNLVGPSTVADSGDAGSGNSHPILQPYITCYMWKRTA